MLKRKPAVAGSFYPADEWDIKNYLLGVIDQRKSRIKPKSIIVPHAGYVYSGFVAAKAYSLLDSFDTYIIIGPNHTGLGEEISVFQGIYEMPFGGVRTDNDIAETIINNSTAKSDYYAHIQEHSIEVQLPFIDYISDKPYTIVPIVIGTHNKDKLRRLAFSISKAIKEAKKDILIIVSSDMNHYENQEITLKKDLLAINAIEELDEEKLFEVVEKYDISMCGAAGSYVAIIASKQLGANRTIVVAHRTSGDVNKDFSQVVGYASIVIE